MSNEKKNPHGRMRQGRICRVGPLVVETITPICQQNGFIQARILLEWEYIVTSLFSQFCEPLKVTFPFKQRHNGRLFLKTTSSMATEISYYEPLILSRINQYFGYQAVSKLTLIQGPINRTTPLKKSPQNSLSQENQALLEQCVYPIEDDRLRTALFELGKEIACIKDTP